MSLILITLCFVHASPSTDPGPFVRALRLVQWSGTPSAVDPVNDVRTKAALSKALGKDGVLTLDEMEGLMAPGTFKRLAGDDGRLDPVEIKQAVESSTPESRSRLFPKIRAHADALLTSFDRIDEPHRRAGEELAAWIVANYHPGRPLGVIVVCTGNSRRSLLGSSMGNIASAYCGMPEVRFYSGGTAPSAFNARTVATLKEIGVEVEPLGEEAPRGEPKTANPKYRVRWGDGALETVEFSKHYADPTNPHNGFAALMVCGEADVACPFVKGAAIRISMPYLDPKIYDDGGFETAKYAERRDDLGRLMLAVMIQARSRLAQGEPAAP